MCCNAVAARRLKIPLLNALCNAAFERKILTLNMCLRKKQVVNIAVTYMCKWLTDKILENVVLKLFTIINPA